LQNRLRISILSFVVFTLSCAVFFKSAKVAVIFSLLLLVHEAGHLAACSRLRIASSLPLFIPFVGAFIKTGKPKSAEDEASLGIGGPLIGTLGCAVQFIWLRIFWPDDIEAVAGIGWAIILNLFNMFPIHPLDGGHIAIVLGQWMRTVGLGMLVLMIWFFPQPILIVVALMALMSPVPAYETVKLGRKAAWALAYVSLLGAILFLAVVVGLAFEVVSIH